MTRKRIDRLDLLTLYTGSLLAGIFLIVSYGPTLTNPTSWASTFIGMTLVVFAGIVGWYLQREDAA